jgi:pimeloyl-ACP methyl ester carboxylesterase
VAVITSLDGVPLHVDERGEGPPVVLVHGMTGSGADWVPVRRELQAHLRVVTYDRRGRGRSGDTASYAFERELDDLRAVLTHVGAPAHLVAHSFGARVALEVAAGRDDLLSLTLYEPPLDGSLLADAHARALPAHRAQEWEAVLAVFHPLAGIPPEELAVYRQVPGAWDAFLDGARTVEREARALAARPVALEAAARVAAPTQLLLGELTDAPVYLAGRDELVGRLGAAVHVLPGQRHTAMVGDPKTFAAAVRRLTG